MQTNSWNIKINVCLSNVFWLYQHGVKKAFFLSYKLSKSEKCKWNTLYYPERIRYTMTYFAKACNSTLSIALNLTCGTISTSLLINLYTISKLKTFSRLLIKRDPFAIFSAFTKLGMFFRKLNLYVIFYLEQQNKYIF